MKTRKKYDNGVKLPIINERFLIIMLKALSSKKADMNRKSLNNIKDLLSVIDMNHYSKDLNVNALLQAIKIALKHKSKTGDKIDKESVIAEVEISISEAFEEPKKNILIPSITICDSIHDIEIETINKSVELYLKYGSVLTSKDDLNTVLSDLTTGNITTMNESIESFRNLINTISEEFRRSDNVTTDMTHSIDDDHYDNFRTVFNNIKNGSTVLKTGLKTLNDQASPEGGLLLGCYYMVYAGINSFKSALLQYFVKWIRMYNSDIFLEDYEKTGKIPTILFYSLENNKRENTRREFGMVVGEDIENFDDEDEMVETYKKAYNATNSIIDVVTIYGEDNSIKPSDITKTIDMLNDNGHNVFCVVIDYIEKLRAEDTNIGNFDNRLRLASISTQLFTIASRRNITVLTAHQINRSGVAEMQEQKDRGMTNVVRSINRRFIGESYAIDKPVDMSWFIALERSIYDNKTYLTMKRGKNRYKVNENDYFVHELRNGFFIDDDIYLKETLSKKAIMPEDDIKLTFQTSRGSPNAIEGKRGMTDIRRKSGTKLTKKEEKEKKKEIELKEDDNAVDLNKIMIAKALSEKNDDTYDLNIEYEETGVFRPPFEDSVYSYDDFILIG